jgi:SET domain
MVDFFAKYEGELTLLAKSEIYDFLVKEVVRAAAGEKKGNTIFKMLPKHPDELIDIKEAGGALKYSIPTSKRNLEWLKRNGMCMDNIYMDASTVPFAGRGAFARRHIPEGRIVTPVPLIQIPDRSVMDMYEVKQSSDSEGKNFFHRDNNDPIGKQLLLNYCYGHSESSLLFFPSGALSVLINHSVEKANVKLRFSDQSFNRKDWMQTPPEKLIDEKHAFLGLLMEIVALRDIKQGEELLMDYGQEWQLAWDAHVKMWSDAVKRGELTDTWPIRALDLSHEYISKPYPTVEEGAAYPENVVQMCFLVVKKGQGVNATTDWAIPSKEPIFDSSNLFECRVTERFELDKLDDFGSTMPYNYTVEWYAEKDGKNHGTQVYNVPHAALVFIDKPMTSDQFVTKSFRHEIGIPDDVFPQGPWRNRRSKDVGNN